MIIIGCDHAGYDLKEKVKKMLEQENYQYEDMCKEYVESDDYTDVVSNMCNIVVANNGNIRDRRPYVLHD